MKKTNKQAVNKAANKVLQQWMQMDFTDPKVKEEVWKPKEAVRESNEAFELRLSMTPSIMPMFRHFYGMNMETGKLYMHKTCEHQPVWATHSSEHRLPLGEYLNPKQSSKLKVL